jgi:hypothetical protein
MRFLTVFFVGVVRHTVAGIFCAATVVAMAAAYYTLRGYGVWVAWAGVAGVFLVSLGLYVFFL